MDVDSRGAGEGAPRRLSPQLLPLHPAPDRREALREGAGRGAGSRTRSARLVRFRHGNIVEPASYEGLAPLDVIFCRNVLIYFSDAMILKVVQALPRGPRPRGLPLPRPRGVAVPHHRPVHAHPLPGRDGLPEGGGRRRAARRGAMIRVLVVDDSTFVRQALTRMLASDPEIEVVGSASDGNEGHDKACALRPDVITLDVKMPRHGRPGGAAPHHEGLPDAGAAPELAHQRRGRRDAARPRDRGHGLRRQVERPGAHEPPRAGRGAEGEGAGAGQHPEGAGGRAFAEALAGDGRPGCPARVAHGAEVVVIGTSTGGPPALQAIIPRLPEGFRIARCWWCSTCRSASPARWPSAWTPAAC